MSLNFGKKPSFGGKRHQMNFHQAEDPLAKVEYTGDLEADASAELSAMEVAYRERSKQEAKRFKDATDSEFWVALCFRTREDKEAFLQEFGLIDLGDKYMEGHKVADRLKKKGSGDA
ncbi:hypothetical protein [Bowdeniella massiliensis]|uniref:hypothetical protein n=1 Tax=Bowdeniella massiliensis TaxID=2932264 RepID=UPI002027A8B4|nr:hypothetical protein [Bowdeniella massiliensis]